jgi:hypothetical protein
MYVYLPHLACVDRRAYCPPSFQHASERMLLGLVTQWKVPCYWCWGGNDNTVQVRSSITGKKIAISSGEKSGTRECQVQVSWPSRGLRVASYMYVQEKREVWSGVCLAPPIEAAIALLM